MTRGSGEDQRETRCYSSQGEMPKPSQEESHNSSVLSAPGSSPTLRITAPTADAARTLLEKPSRADAAERLGPRRRQARRDASSVGTCL